MDRSKRFFPNDGTLISFDPEREIPLHLALLVTKYPPSKSTFCNADGQPRKYALYGFFAGTLSVAHGLFMISLPDCAYANTPIEGALPIEWAERYLKCAEEMIPLIPEEPAGPRSSGISFTLVCYSAIAAVIRKDPQHVSDMASYVSAVVTDDDEPPYDEWICGRAGFLYLLRLVALHLPQHAHLIPTSANEEVIEALLRRSPDKPDPWRFLGGIYLGLGHGWMGIITQILLSDPKQSSLCRPWIVHLINEQLPDGNWNKFVESPDHKDNNASDWLQIGHGAPGMVVGLMAIRPIYDSAGDREMVDSIDNAIVKAQDVIWARGSLTKESCLQHGAAGNSLVLLDRKRKATFLAQSTARFMEPKLANGSLEASSSPYGLHRGLVGTIWAMIEYERNRSGVMPSFNDA